MDMKGEYDFIAVDFETATEKRDSACAIGIAAVKDRKIVDTFYSLIQPPENFYSPHNIEIHKITPDMTNTALPFSEIWGEQKLYHLFSSALVVSHNAPFDMAVLYASISPWASRQLDFKYIDSMSIAKDFVHGVKSLEHCAEHFSISMGTHHNALDDAKTCANIVLHCLNLSGYQCIDQFCIRTTNVKIRNFSDMIPKKSSTQKKYQNVSAKYIVPDKTEFDPSHPFYQKYIAFTGDLSLARPEMMKLAANVGAIPKDDISRKINYLVIGTFQPEYVDGNGLSRKQRKAIDLNEKEKSNIQFISEKEFFDILEG